MTGEADLPARLASAFDAALASGRLAEASAEVTKQVAMEATSNAEEANLMTGESDLPAQLASAFDAALASGELAGALAAVEATQD